MHTQHGAALVETLLALLPVMLLGSMSIELAYGYQVRHLLTLALQEAGRVAAVHQAEPRAWQPALDASISRLDAPAGRFASSHHRREAQRAQFQRMFSLPRWQAVQLASTPETIHLQLTYLHTPWQKWLRLTLQAFYNNSHSARIALAREPKQPNTLAQRAWRQGLVPIVVEHRVLRHRSLKPF